MGNYSKMFGSLVGGVVGMLATFGLPVEWATPEVQGAIVVGLSTLFTYMFPANQA